VATAGTPSRSDISPKNVAGAEGAGHTAVPEHLHLPREDDVQTVPPGSLGDDHLSSQRVARPEPGRQLPAIALLQRTEQGRRGEEVAQQALPAEGLQRSGHAGVAPGELHQELTGDLQHLRVLGERVDAGSAWPSCQERHLAEELARLQRRDWMGEPVVLPQDRRSPLADDVEAVPRLALLEDPVTGLEAAERTALHQLDERLV
jgi:hypothetical protein